MELRMVHQFVANVYLLLALVLTKSGEGKLCLQHRIVVSVDHREFELHFVGAVLSSQKNVLKTALQIGLLFLLELLFISLAFSPQSLFSDSPVKLVVQQTSEMTFDADLEHEDFPLVDHCDVHPPFLDWKSNEIVVLLQKPQIHQVALFHEQNSRGVFFEEFQKGLFVGFEIHLYPEGSLEFEVVSNE